MANGLQYYDLSLSAGAQRNIGAPGNYLRYYSGNAAGADESIVVKTDTGALYCILKPGQSIKLPQLANEWKVTARTPSSVISGILIIGEGELQDNQVSGTVSVINGELSRVNPSSAIEIA
jgi:outer membrane protein assembly factor BamB